MAFAIVVWAVGGLFKVTSYVALMGKISDGLFVSGVLLAGSGGLIASFNEGIFDGLAYGMHGLFGFRNIKKTARRRKKAITITKSASTQTKNLSGTSCSWGLVSCLSEWYFSLFR